AVLHFAFDQFVTEQREHAIADEERTRVAVPVDARSNAIIRPHRLIVRAELPGLLETRAGIADEHDRGGILEQLRVLLINQRTHRKAEQSAALPCGLVEKGMSARLALG